MQDQTAQANSRTRPLKSWTIQRGETTLQARGRAAAVARAKELSSGRRRIVVVERDDGGEQMTFKQGSLETGIKHTDRRRR